MSTDDQNWGSNGNGRSPGRERNGGEPPRRSSRSRSPGPPREERGSVYFMDLGSILAVHASLGNKYSMVVIITAQTQETTSTFQASATRLIPVTSRPHSLKLAVSVIIFASFFFSVFIHIILPGQESIGHVRPSYPRIAWFWIRDNGDG